MVLNSSKKYLKTVRGLYEFSKLSKFLDTARKAFESVLNVPRLYLN